MNKKAFTLIELLVVVLIIGILSAIALPQYQTATDRARLTELQIFLRHVIDAQEAYHLANGNYAVSCDLLDVEWPGGITPNANATDITIPGKFNIRCYWQSATVAGVYLNSQLSYELYLDHVTHTKTGVCWASSARYKKLCATVCGAISGPDNNAICMF